MKKLKLYALPYFFWLGLFVVIPLSLLIYQSFQTLSGQISLRNYLDYFSNPVYLRMTVNSLIYAGIISVLCFLVAYPTAYVLTKFKHKEFWLLLIILPTWINLLLKAYAFMGIFGQNGTINSFLTFIGIGPKQLLFTDFSFIFVASYIALPFMILPIYNSLNEMNRDFIHAAYDLGATRRQAFLRIMLPLSLSGIKAGFQAVFIPSLSLFMIVRLIGGNRVITLGTAVEEHFLTTQNWGAGSTIGVILVIVLLAIMYLMRDRGRGMNEE